MMTSTPRLDDLAASGTSDVFECIRLADRHRLAVKIRPGSDVTKEVVLLEDLVAPVAYAWLGVYAWEMWTAEGDLSGRLHCDVPVQAVRELIEQHGGEHAEQVGGMPTPQDFTDAEAIAQDLATRALADWGMMAHLVEDEAEETSWLVIARDQSTTGLPGPDMPHAVLYLHDREDPDGRTVLDVPDRSWDRWCVKVTDASGEHHLITRPVAQLDHCVHALADWLTSHRTPR